MWSSGIQDGSVIVGRRNQLCNQGNEASLVHQQNHLHSKNGLLHCVRWTKC
jgi:hypothetical protein